MAGLMRTTILSPMMRMKGKKRRRIFN